jgi:hypothetical protein
MHYHTEIILPPVSDIKSAIDQIMKPFDENGAPGYNITHGHAFWDYWRIGGRWSGHKLMKSFGVERMEDFRKQLNTEGITVSGLVFGKETLSPASQISRVDAMWSAAFPESPIKVCPLFDHYSGEYGDVMVVSKIPGDLEADHVIIAGPAWQSGDLEAKTMLIDSIYNGVSVQPTNWDRLISSALAKHTSFLANAKEDYRAIHTVRPDWLCVTVDYHS